MHPTRLCLTLALLLIATSASARQAIFLVRHAERADAGAMKGMMADDPDLSGEGRARAESLVKLLHDAKIRTIITTEFKRTQQTAAPLARALGIQPTVIRAKDAASLTARMKSASGNVLMVGHSNTVPAAVKSLGIEEEVAIGEQDYDNLLIVVPGDRPTLVRLRF